MRKTYDFPEFVSESLNEDYHITEDSSRRITEAILKEIPNSTYAVKETELIDITASKIDASTKPIGSEFFKQWNGRVVSIENHDTFVAMVESVKSNREVPKIVRFNRHMVSIVNGELMEEGATFYWTVGLFRNQQNSLVKRSEIRFKMVARPSPALLKSIGEDLERLFDGISWME